MASWGSTRPRTKPNEEEEEDETHPKIYNFDLNKEPEEDIDLNEVAQVNKDANQNDEGDTAAFALCHIMLLRDIEQDGNLEEGERIKRRKFIAESKQGGEDDSDATLRKLSRWDIPEIPPRKIINRSMIEECSRPIRKQMTTKGVLTLGLSKSQVREKFLPFLEKTRFQHGEYGIRVSVYGPDGKDHKMMMYLNEEKTELGFTSGWSKFVEVYDLKDLRDFVTVWMFRHKYRCEICLAIDIKRLSFTKQVSKRISKAAFDDREVFSKGRLIRVSVMESVSVFKGFS